VAVEAAADLYTITFDDRGVAALDVLEVTDDLVFVDDGAFCKCHDGLLVYRGVVAT
tara:strand:+ start:1274 stop:1441 length:168 start_codon:yes stop_codon:yes gene_type:complete